MTSAAFYFDAKSLGRPWGFNVASQALSGTDTIVLEIATYFADTEANVFLLATSAPIEPSAKVILVNDLAAAVQECERRGIGKLIFVALANPEQLQLLRRKKPGKVKLIAWAHNTPTFEYLTAAYRCPDFEKLIAVSNVQAYSLAHHPIFDRTWVAPNFVDLAFWDAPDEVVAANHTVVSYIGALKPAKGFHLLARIWPAIARQHPQARLNVCGSPGLYGKTESLGQYGIAEAQYEQLILAPLGGSRESAQSLGVTFLGSLTKHRLREQIQQSSLVVVNPTVSGSIETFCLSAAEPLALGVPVVGGHAGGLLEVVGHEQGGLLAHDSAELQAHLQRLIEQPEQRAAFGREGQARTRKLHSKKAALERWSALLNDQDIPQFTLADAGLFPPDFHRRRRLRKWLPLGLLDLARRGRRVLKGQF
jgi:glycosyltransferase involved in cell wall biosynthesis